MPQKVCWLTTKGSSPDAECTDVVRSLFENVAKGEGEFSDKLRLVSSFWKTFLARRVPLLSLW